MLNRLPSKCKQCREKFTPEERERGRPLHDHCIDAFAKSREDRSKKRDERNARMARVVVAKQDKARKEKLKRIPDYIKEAQRSFNAYIRTRDRLSGVACISSGRVLDWSGNAVDAGHYRSVGSAPHLRFDERNCHAQSKHDNQWRSGNAVDYRIGLIQRIGIEAVEALEADNRVHKWTREELIAIRDKYKAKRRELERAKE